MTAALSPGQEEAFYTQVKPAPSDGFQGEDSTLFAVDTNTRMSGIALSNDYVQVKCILIFTKKGRGTGNVLEKCKF